jgi:hypothetical protein
MWKGDAEVPEECGGRLVPPPRGALLQHPLHDLLLVRQPVDREDVEPTQDHHAQGTGSHGQAGARELPRQDCHGPSGRMSPGLPTGAHRRPGVPGPGAEPQCNTRRGGTGGSPECRPPMHTHLPVSCWHTHARGPKGQHKVLCRCNFS